MKTITSRDTLMEYLDTHNLIETLGIDNLEYLQLHSFKAGEIIVVEDDTPHFLYMILKGRARVSPSSEDGRLALLDYIMPFDLLGDIEYFSGDVNFHSVLALEDSIFLAIPFEYIETCFGRSPKFYRFLCENMAKKITTTSMKYSRALLYPLRNRLAKLLYEMAECNKTNRIKLIFKQTAEYFGITPRHFRRILCELEDEGVIQRHHNTIEILDMDMLSRLSSYK